jgi:hypothetical protein
MRKLAVIFIFLSGFSFGQSVFIGANYKMNVPVLDFRNHISPISFSGVDIDFRYFKNDWFSFGLRLGWSSFYENVPVQTYYWDNMALTAEQWNYIYQSDFAFQAHFYLPTKVFVKPYLGINFGASFIQDYKKVGDLIFNQNLWGVSYMPEIGILFHLPKPDGLAFYMSFGFNQILLKNNHYNDVSNLVVKVGMAFSGHYRKSTQEKIKKAKEKAK